ncbi:MAG: CDP-glucose 4,6-dehydratase [Bacilli bacterium]
MNFYGFYRRKRILITGHTGFKGSWLCSILLELQSEICGISLEPKTDPNLFSQLKLGERISSHNIIDIRDFKKVKEVFDKFQPEIVFHLAAQPLVINSYENPVYTYDVNVMGTVNICECVRLCKSVKSFVNITTDKVYENIDEENHAYVETDRLNGYDPYSNSKSCSELVTDSYKKSFFNDLKIAVSTCRAGNVIGGGDYSENRIIPDCIKAAKHNEVIILRNPDSIRPYQHVLEADFFYLNIALQQYNNLQLSGSYNIGPDKEDIVRTSQICDLFCQFWGQGLSWTEEKKSNYHEAKYLKLDCSLSKSILNWSPTWAMRESLQNIVWWEKQNDKITATTSTIIKYFDEIQI